ncbi:adenine phosphoribosyltransferase [Amycolatopsis antarctica]|uniref:Adenine phosphoribosyltransferase n=1 Tax=Amycolatopsis antarctica TaxID=1854586 RepID=A0A263D2Y5_9PSEU|nr:adenine phosphoribosyltransferase [Amycolatopsis antarctica]OZM72438.1 adenine phosphoribosyltransferase [Amycolatopsis antarctica]
MLLDEALDRIAEVPDFPEPGVLFRDLTPLLADPAAFAATVDALAAGLPEDTGLLAAVEARGFLLAAAIGYSRGIGVVPVRKPGKLPAVADRIEYELEYGSAVLELPAGLVAAGDRVTVVDDVLATGGTAAAAVGLLERAGARVDGVTVVLELAALGGRALLGSRPVRALRVL